MKDILEFQNEHRWLSNFAPVKVMFNGLIFPSVEHAYVAAKFDDINLQKEVQKLPNAGDAKRFGRKNKDAVAKDFDEVKVTIMKKLLMQKYNQAPYRAKLIATGDCLIQEGNYWNDAFWGVCKGKGENNLGKIIMAIRADLKVAGVE